ncbi:MAG: hypothetical protein M3354_08020 [Chloroflexota bacterium]|nr:hypothetical protein [Chloroflexota bacterium]
MSLTTKEFFGPLEGQSFNSYEEVENRIWARYNEVRPRLPGDYGFTEIMAWTYGQNLIVSNNEHGLIVSVNGHHHAHADRDSETIEPE